MVARNNINLNKIVFVASYMKSGNTWVRSIICSLLNNGNFKLSDLEKIKLFSQEKFFFNLPNIKYQKDGNINFDFVSSNWINAQKKICQKEKNKIIFFKTHNVRGIINNNFFTNENVCKGYIYLIRDPRDIVISYAKFMNKSYDEIIERMCSDKLYNTFLENDFSKIAFLGSWRFNYISWRDGIPNIPKIIVKYEDLLKNTKNE